MDSSGFGVLVSQRGEPLRKPEAVVSASQLFLELNEWIVFGRKLTAMTSGQCRTLFG